MRSSWPLALLCLALPALGGCDRRTPGPPAPRVEAAPPAASGAGTSVPGADAVPTPDGTAPHDPAAGRSNADLDKAQESGAMPLPGQNNDHSAPAGPAARASAP